MLLDLLSRWSSRHGWPPAVVMAPAVPHKAIVKCLGFAGLPGGGGSRGDGGTRSLCPVTEAGCLPLLKFQ